MPRCPFQLKPSEIVARLNEHAIGQETAKKTLAVAIYGHFRRMAATAPGSVELTKSNILLIGPTGTGKTLLGETLARILDLPFVTADATSLAQTQFVGDEIEAILHRLLDRAGGDLAKAQRGIVFVDEVRQAEGRRRSVPRHLGRERAARPAQDHGGARVKLKDRATDRHHADPVHLWRRLCRARSHPDQDAHLRLHRHAKRRRPEDPRTPERPHQADRPAGVRPDPRIRRPPAHRHPPARADAGHAGAHPD